MSAELLTGDQVRFRADSPQFAACGGLVWTIMSSHPHVDARVGKRYVWIEVSDDIVTRTPSRRRGRNAYLDALEAVTR